MSEKTTTAQTVRESAALAASGAFDTPISKPLSSYAKSVTLWCTYTRGASGGCCKLRPEISLDGVTWYRPTLAQSSSAAAPFGTVPLLAQQYEGPVPANGSPLYFAVPLDVAGARFIRIAAAESGATGSPGTLALSLSEDAS
jgi:hypothetical protein